MKKKRGIPTPNYGHLYRIYSDRKAKGGSKSFDLRNPSFWTSPCCALWKGCSTICSQEWGSVPMSLDWLNLNIYRKSLFDYVVNTIINRPFGDGLYCLYHPFMVIWGMVCIGFNTLVGKFMGKMPWRLLLISFSRCDSFGQQPSWEQCFSR